MKTYSFGKWEGISFECEGEEEYPIPVYEGEYSVEEYLSKFYKGSQVIQHTYRYLEYGEDTYEAGETFTTHYTISPTGEVTQTEPQE